MAGVDTLYYIGPGSLSALPGVNTARYTIWLTDASGNLAITTGIQDFTLSDGGAGGTFTVPGAGPFAPGAPGTAAIAPGSGSVQFAYSNLTPSPTNQPYILTTLPNGGALAGLPQSQQLPGVVGITTSATISRYAQWPIMADVQRFLVRAGIVMRFAVAQEVIDGVIDEIEHSTLRQFVADTQDTVKIYDGTGTAEIEVDEIVSLTGVVIVGYQSAPGYTLTEVAVAYEPHKPRTRLICARGSLPALVGEGYIAPYPTQFPSGRQNIQATGCFGYGPSIPRDLWNAACGEMALRLTREAIYDRTGLLIEVGEGDEKQKFTDYEIEVLGWHTVYLKALMDYTRPSGRRLRNLRPRPIS